MLNRPGLRARVFPKHAGLDNIFYFGYNRPIFITHVPTLEVPFSTSRLYRFTMSDARIPDLQSGMVVKVHQKIKEVNSKGEEKERIQIFEGIIISMKHGREPGATITVRKVSDGVGVERIFPIHSPVIDTIEVVRHMRVNQAKPLHLRHSKKRLKEVAKKEAPKKA